MPSVDVVDETFVVVPPQVLAAEFATPARWRALWPDLDLEVMTDRGAAGFRWTVTGALVGSMEVWLEPVLDGTVLHYFLRADPPARRRPARLRRRRRRQRRQRAAKAIAFACKDALEAGRAAGEPPAPGSVGPIMRVHVVSDVHGHAEALARAGDGADALVVLGDLVDFVDYVDPARGILGRVFGPEISARFGQLRAAGQPGRLRASSGEAWSRFPIPPPSSTRRCREQYTALFAAMPTPTYAIRATSTSPTLWPEFARPGVCQGRRPGRHASAGCASGSSAASRCPPGTAPFRRPRVDAAACARPRTTPPPSSGSASSTSCAATPRPPCPSWPTTWSRGVRSAPSTALLAAIRRDRPRAPCSGTSTSRSPQRCRVGRTECVNVGHFRQTATPYVLRW